MEVVLVAWQSSTSMFALEIDTNRFISQLGSNKSSSGFSIALNFLANLTSIVLTLINIKEEREITKFMKHINDTGKKTEEQDGDGENNNDKATGADKAKAKKGKYR